VRTYAEEYRRSIEDPTGFWGEQAKDLRWIRAPRTVLDDDGWFPDGVLNTCFNALDRHVIEGRADQAALIHDSPVTGSRRTWSYAELLDEVARAAGFLRDLGVGKGDRVLLYLPMIPEAVIAMLACARLGAVHSVVFGGFAPAELAVRIDDAQPTVVISASCGLEATRVIEYKPLLDAALQRATHRPAHVVIVQRPQAPAPLGPQDLDWKTLMSPTANAPAACEPVAATDPLYILYTSGTTGRPKGIVRDNGGHAVALRWSMGAIYGIGPGDVMFTASDVGWVVGHSYIVYGPLLAGATTVLYEGKPVGTPDAGAFWRVAAEHAAAAVFTAPTAIRAIRKEDPDAALLAGHDLSRLRTLFLAGERLDPDTWRWATETLGVPVVDNWWQTETGWPIAANPQGLAGDLPIRPGSPTVPMPGYDVHVLDGDGADVPRGTEGAICLKLPLPPGTLRGVWRDDERFRRSYLETYPGYYLSGDGGRVDEDGYVFVMGRTDDVINVAGHRLSTGSMEAVLSAHPAVAECAVVGVADALKGQLPRGFVVLKAGVRIDPETLRAELVAAVRAEIGAVASLREIDVVPALPKTRSGKILRRTMREIADGGDPPVPGTIEDATVLDRLAPILRKGGV
jgi:propionyl-CoA synthetase